MGGQEMIKDMERYLRATDIIDWGHTRVLDLAKALSQGAGDSEEMAERCFHWVRDNIRHSYDYRMSPVTCTASEVLASDTGYCYAKSHLLAALLRANGIPAGLCYQRLSLESKGPPFVLHGLVAAHISPYGWYRMDPRGNRADIDARFTPPVEALAFHVELPEEADLPEIWPDPLPVVIEALRAHRTWDEMYGNLPDIELIRTGDGRGV